MKRKKPIGRRIVKPKLAPKPDVRKSAGKPAPSPKGIAKAAAKGNPARGKPKPAKTSATIARPADMRVAAIDSKPVKKKKSAAAAPVGKPAALTTKGGKMTARASEPAGTRQGSAANATVRPAQPTRTLDAAPPVVPATGAVQTTAPTEPAGPTVVAPNRPTIIEPATAIDYVSPATAVDQPTVGAPAEVASPFSTAPSVESDVACASVGGRFVPFMDPTPNPSHTGPEDRNVFDADRHSPLSTPTSESLQAREDDAPAARNAPAASPPAAPVDEPAEGDSEPSSSLPQPPVLFEVAWEVCWQLGGIYTVLRTKVPTMLERWDDRYFLIGPYNPHTAALEFEERPTEGYIRETLDRLRNAGMACHYGRWLVPGRPNVILLDYRARYASLDADKYLLWKDHGISTPSNDGEVNEVTAFGFAVAEFFRELCNVQPGRPIIAHFHEWMAGVAVPRIAHLKYPVTTVFTTHATLLGRYLASDSADFYQHLPFINADAEAAKYNIHARFSIERAAAHSATVFTTVSEVTAREAKQLLGRDADLILPNGLNVKRFAALHEFQNLHRTYKERIHDFVMGHFFPSYSFDLDRTIYLFTSGRYEYRNKGMDLYIEALHRLNWRLKGMADRPTVVAFIVTRLAVRNINVGALQNQSMFQELKNTCSSVSGDMNQRLFAASAVGRMPTYEELLPDDAQVRLKRAVHAWRTHRPPLIVTHDLADDRNDAVLQHLRHRGLLNSADDPVKVVFHPEFMTATSPLLPLDYEQFVRGCHMGIFPSYYEPWGYTPMECVALGVPSVSTDLSGFGAYVQSHIRDSAQQGLCVLNRSSRGFDEAVGMLADYLFQFTQLSRRDRIELRNKVERLSDLFDWSALIRHYHDAHDLALSRIGVKLGRLEVRVV